MGPICLSRWLVLACACTFVLWVVPWLTAWMWVSKFRSVFLLRLLPRAHGSRGVPQWLLLLARQQVRPLLVVLWREVVHPIQRRRLSRVPQSCLLPVGSFLFIMAGLACIQSLLM